MSMNKFNDEPDDMYPSWTLCFQGDKFHWFNDDIIFDSYALNATQYELMLKGEESLMNERNKASSLYTKKQVFMNDGQNIDFDRFYLKATDFIYELKYFTEKAMEDIHYLKTKNENETLDAYVHLSYQSADKICFTRNSNDLLKSIRLRDLITFNSTLMNRYNHTIIQVFIHRPEHLIASFDNPKHISSFPQLMTSLYDGTEKEIKVLEFKISQVKQLRKRSDSNAPCNSDINNYDHYFKDQIIKELGCIPPYWIKSVSNFYKFKECANSTALQNAHLKISEPKKLLEQRQLPCYEMSLLSIESINNHPSPRPKDISMEFVYTEKAYEEVKYSRMMGFDGWLSNVGGFIGIFLGYSMLQIPGFLQFVMGLIIKKMHNENKCNQN